MKYKSGILIILITFFLIIYFSPVVFMKDGLLTKTKADNFNQRYSLGRTNKHTGDFTNIYMFYVGIKQPEVFKESHDKEDFASEKIFLKKIAPCLYKWEWDFNTSTYRVLVDDHKYYYTIVVT